MKILSLNRLTPLQTDLIMSACSDAEVRVSRAVECAPYLADTEILIAYGQTDLAPIVPNAPRLRWVQSLSAGVDGMLACDAFRNSKIILTSVRGIHGIPMSEHVLGMMLSFSRRLLVAYDNQREHKWNPLSGIDEIYDKTAAVIGLGTVGGAIARVLKAMGMRVIGVRHGTEGDSDVLLTPDRLNEALTVADFVIVTLPLTRETDGLFDAKAFAMMKSTAVFINVSRGPVVNEADLIAALNGGVIGGAALDVFCEEPLPASSPLWGVKNLLITPHYAAISPKYMDRAIGIFAQNLRGFPDESKMVNVIDKSRGY